MTMREVELEIKFKTLCFLEPSIHTPATPTTTPNIASILFLFLSGVWSMADREVEIAGAKLDDAQAQDAQGGGAKRSYGEMASRDLAKVFFHHVSKKIIVDAMPRVQHLEQTVNTLRQTVSFYQQICPPCVTNVDPHPDNLYCYDCGNSLSCIDWKHQRQFEDCSGHDERRMCSECDIQLCPNCITTCATGMEEYCADCLHMHAQTCQACRLEFIM